MNRSEFVKLLIDNGYNLKEFTEYQEMIFTKINCFGENEIKTIVNFLVDTKVFNTKYDMFYIYRLRSNDNKKIQDFICTFKDVKVNENGLFSTLNYTSIVL